MRITQLIKDLEKALEIHGDVQVVTREYGFGGSAEFICDGVSQYPSTIYQECIGGEDADEHAEFRLKIVQQVFPDWNGDVETLDELEPVAAVILTQGDKVYES